MKRLIISVTMLLLFVVALTGCYPSKKSQNELRGLMLLENLQLKKNKAYYSRHNIKAKKEAYRKYKKNSRLL
jgi:hypothetical protein